MSRPSKLHARSTALTPTDLNGAFVNPHDLRHDGESHAPSRQVTNPRCRCVPDRLSVHGVLYSRAGIRNLHDYVVAPLSQPDRHDPSFRCELDRILNNIRYRLPDQVPVPRNGQVRHLSMLVGIAFQGSRGIYETSEGRYAECAREMLESGNLLEPQLGYRPHWTKPALTYWTLVAGMKGFGVNEWGLRLPNALAFILTTMVVVMLGRKLFDQQTGVAAGLIYATSPFAVLAENSITTDTLLTLWETAAVFCFVAAWKSERSAIQRGWIAGIWVMFGLGFLTKGPPALLPLLPILLSSYRNRGKLQCMSWLGLLLFFSTAFSWYAWAIATHPGLLRYWLGTEVVNRVASSSVHNHAWYKGFTVILPPLLLGLGFWLIPLIRKICTQERAHLRALRIAITNNRSLRFLLMWLTLPLAILMVSRSKLELYGLPVFVPLALIAGHTLRRTPVPLSRRSALSIGLLSVFVLVSARAATACTRSRKDMKVLGRMCHQYELSKPDYYVWNQAKLFGLQFYLGGRLKRAAFSGDAEWADISARDLLTKLKREAPHRTNVVIVNKARNYDLDRIFSSRDINYSIVSNQNWALYAIGPANQIRSPQS